MFYHNIESLIGAKETVRFVNFMENTFCDMFGVNEMENSRRHGIIT